MFISCLLQWNFLLFDKNHASLFKTFPKYAFPTRKGFIFLTDSEIILNITLNRHSEINSHQVSWYINIDRCFIMAYKLKRDLRVNGYCKPSFQSLITGMKLSNPGKIHFLQARILKCDRHRKFSNNNSKTWVKYHQNTP